MSDQATGCQTVVAPDAVTDASEDVHVSTNNNNSNKSGDLELNMGADWLETYMSDPNAFDADIGDDIFGKDFVKGSGFELDLDACSSDNASQTSSASEIGHNHLPLNRNTIGDGSAGDSITRPAKSRRMSEDSSASAESPPPKSCDPKAAPSSAEWRDVSRDMAIRESMTAILINFLRPVYRHQGNCVPASSKESVPGIVKKLEAGLYHAAASREEYCDVATVAARVRSLVQLQLRSRQKSVSESRVTRSARSSTTCDSDSANPLAFYGAAEGAPAAEVETVAQRKVMLVGLFKLFAVGGPWESRVPESFKNLLPSFVGRLEAALHHSAQSQAEYLNEATLQTRLAKVAKQLIR